MLGGTELTFARYRQNGRPWSLANAQVIRDADARKAMVAQIPNATMTIAIPVLPPTDCVACTKMARKGKPVGVSIIDSAETSPEQNRTAMSIAKPSVPFNKTLTIIERGTFVEALEISSDICCGNQYRLWSDHGYYAHESPRQCLNRPVSSLSTASNTYRHDLPRNAKTLP